MGAFVSGLDAWYDIPILASKWVIVFSQMIYILVVLKNII